MGFSDSFKSRCGRFEMKNVGGVKISEGGPVSGRCAEFDGKNYLTLPYADTGALNVKTNAVTVVAWVKWSGEGIGFVGGMWNEHSDGGKRQYGLFVSLPYYNGGDQVCGHISRTGKPTPPFPFSIDYSASAQKVPHGKWACVAFTYDGKYIRSYLDGKFAERPRELIDHTKGFPGYPDGLVQSKIRTFPRRHRRQRLGLYDGRRAFEEGHGQFFKGRIGAIAVYDRALSGAELSELAAAYPLE